MFRKPVALILAVSLSVLSVPAAAAPETGLFGELSQSEGADARLAVLDEAAEQVSVSQISADYSIEISQAYYEGNRIYLSYRTKGCQVVQDGLDLADGSYADITAGEETERGDGSVIGWKECIVPENGLADTQTFGLVYRTPGSEQKETLAVTLKQHTWDRYLQGDSPAADYQAHAVLYTGKVDLKGIVRIISPEQAASWTAWQEGEEGTGADVIACWNLYQNGEPVSPDLFGESAVNGTEEVVFAVMFPFMNDLSGLALVPEYSEGGEKPDEAIPLEPDETDQVIEGSGE